MSDAKLFTLGNLTVDDIVLYNEQRMYCASIGAWIWHKPVGLIARAGQAYPAENIQQIEAVGITCRLQRVANPDIRNWALYEPDGRRQFVNHLTSGSYEQMSIHGDEIPEECMGASAYHIAPMPVHVQHSVIQRLRTGPCLISLDQYDRLLADPQAKRTALELIIQVDFYLPSGEEAAALYGSNDPESAALAFGALGVPVVCIKMGVQGALLYMTRHDELYHIPICPVKTVDPTGAGDAFCGGFLAGALATGDPLLAACHGAVSASYVVQHVGALSLLEADFSDRQDRLEQVRAGIKTIQ
jgi:sugar/nucleoside kinase (ribokinase family)